MSQIYVNVFPSSVRSRFLSLGRTIMSLFMPVHLLNLILVYYKDDTVRSNLPQVDQCIYQLDSWVHFSLESCMHTCMHGKDQPPPFEWTAPFGWISITIFCWNFYLIKKNWGNKKTSYILTCLFIIPIGYTPFFSTPCWYIVVLVLHHFICILVRSTQYDKPAYAVLSIFFNIHWLERSAIFVNISLSLTTIPPLFSCCNYSFVSYWNV